MNYEYRVQILSPSKDEWLLSADTFVSEIYARVWARRYCGVCPKAKTRIVRRPKDWEVVE